MKKYIYKLKSEVIHNKFYKNIERLNKEENIIKLMNIYIKNLKEINLIYTRADIEELNYNKTKYPDKLFSNDIKNRYRFFAIILGFLDGNIDFINKRISTDDNVDNTIASIFKFRNNITNDFKRFISLADCNTLKETILTTPCYKNFNNCLERITTCKCNNLIQLDLINAYLIGYKNYNSYSIYEIYSTYLTLLEDLESYKISNEKRVNKLRVKKKIR